MAVKKLKLVADGADEDEEMANYAVLTAERELALLRTMGSHPNVVSLVDSWAEDLSAGSVSVRAPVLCFELLAMTALHALEDGGPSAFPRRALLELTGDLCAALAREGTGGFNVTSTCECSDEMCQRKYPLFENSTRDDLSSKNESKRVKTDRDTSLER